MYVTLPTTIPAASLIPKTIYPPIYLSSLHLPAAPRPLAAPVTHLHQPEQAPQQAALAGASAAHHTNLQGQSASEQASESVCVYIYVCIYMCVCVCVRMRERLDHARSPWRLKHTRAALRRSCVGPTNVHSRHVANPVQAPHPASPSIFCHAPLQPHVVPCRAKRVPLVPHKTYTRPPSPHLVPGLRLEADTPQHQRQSGPVPARQAGSEQDPILWSMY